MMLSTCVNLAKQILVQNEINTFRSAAARTISNRGHGDLVGDNVTITAPNSNANTVPKKLGLKRLPTTSTDSNKTPNGGGC